MTDKKLSNADVAAKHKEFLFPERRPLLRGARRPRERQGVALSSDHDGKQYLDFFGGILTVSVGHANDKVNAAVHAQMERLGHVSTLYPTLPIVELAEKLVNWLAPGEARRRPSSRASGTEADETAVALAQVAHRAGKSSSRSATATPGARLLAQSLTGARQVPRRSRRRSRASSTRTLRTATAVRSASTTRAAS